MLYAMVGTTLTHLIGRALIALNFQQQRYEADFRFNLVRTRENSEQIALLGGEAAERERHLGRFSNIVTNWLAIMSRQKKLTFFTSSYSQVATIFPYVVVSPAYFSRRDAARRTDADGVGLQQRAERAVLLRHAPIATLPNGAPSSSGSSGFEACAGAKAGPRQSRRR